MELATSLARIEGSEMHVVHAWRLFGETLLSGSGRMSQGEVKKLHVKYGWNIKAGSPNLSGNTLRGSQMREYIY